MSVIIRNVRVEEFDAFIRFIERTFGLYKGFFPRVYPHLYRPTPEACGWAYVVEADGRIVSHVGLYPIETVTAGVRLRIGGIGAVSTAPNARGKGYMSQLLPHVIGEMRRLEYPISWLGGDRQRYGAFGWEMAGLLYQLKFSARSLERTQVQPATVEEVLPAEALVTVARLQSLPACYPIRPGLEHQIQKAGMRFWLAADGYAITESWGERLTIVELVSTSGNEVGMIRAMLNWTDFDEAAWELSAWDAERLGRLMRHVSYWSAGNNRMYRINDLAALLTAAQPVLNQRAAALRDFAVSIGIQESDRLSVTHIAVEKGTVQVERDRRAAIHLEIPVAEAARLFLGGPPIAAHAQLPEGLRALLPIPVFVAPMEHV